MKSKSSYLQKSDLRFNFLNILNKDLQSTNQCRVKSFVNTATNATSSSKKSARFSTTNYNHNLYLMTCPETKVAFLCCLWSFARKVSFKFRTLESAQGSWRNFKNGSRDNNCTKMAKMDSQSRAIQKTSSNLRWFTGARTRVLRKQKRRSLRLLVKVNSFGYALNWNQVTIITNRKECSAKRLSAGQTFLTFLS